MLNMLPDGSLNSSEQGVLKGKTWELVIWRDRSKILSHFPAISQPLLKEVRVYLQPDLCLGKRKEWYTIKGTVVWILSGCTFISFIWDASVHTLLWNSIINHWFQREQWSSALFLSSFPAQILAWKCFLFSLWQQLSKVDFAGSFRFSSLWLLYLCCKSLIWCLRNCHVWGSKAFS